MSLENFMSNPVDDFPRNMELAEGLRPDKVAQTNQDWHDSSDQYADIMSTLYEQQCKIHWVGDAGDAARQQALKRKDTADDQRNTLQGYAKTSIGAFAEDMATTKAQAAVLGSGGLAAMLTGDVPEATAKLMQNLYGPVGISRAYGLLYPGGTIDLSGINDRGATPIGPDIKPVGSGGGVGGGVPHSGGDAAMFSPSSPTGEQPQSAQDPSGDKAGGKGDGLGGAPSGGGDGKGSGGGPGGGPPSGPPPGGMDPSGFGDPAAAEIGDSLPDGPDSSGLGSGFVGAPGLGGLGAGDRERPLNQKPGSGGTGKPTVNFNAGKTPAGSPSVIGGGGMAPGQARKKDDEEHKAADYLTNQANTDELLGPSQSVAPDVLGTGVVAEAKPVEAKAEAGKDDKEAGDKEKPTAKKYTLLRGTGTTEEKK